ncbi:MAG: transcriptional regulator NrdR [Desulfobacterales bacterium]
MKCPYCGALDNRVIDSRLSRDEIAIRRRRECLVCQRRFTTFEHVEDIPIMVVKKDGRREIFSRDKVRTGILKACEKRDISIHLIEDFLDELERELRENEEKEIPTSVIGEKIMARLHQIDEVAYVRFASVYREFRDVNDFVLELQQLIRKEKSKMEQASGLLKECGENDGQQTAEH